jgi:hypothetical protein
MFRDSVDSWRKSQNECPLCTLLIHFLPTPPLDEALLVSAMRNFLKMEFLRPGIRLGLWESPYQTFATWVFSPLNEWIKYLEKQPFLNLASDGDTMKASALFLDRERKYSILVSDLALSGALSVGLSGVYPQHFRTQKQSLESYTHK